MREQVAILFFRTGTKRILWRVKSEDKVLRYIQRRGWPVQYFDFYCKGIFISRIKPGTMRSPPR